MNESAFVAPVLESVRVFSSTTSCLCLEGTLLRVLCRTSDTNLSTSAIYEGREDCSEVLLFIVVDNMVHPHHRCQYCQPPCPLLTSACSAAVGPLCFDFLPLLPAAVTSLSTLSRSIFWSRPSLRDNQINQFVLDVNFYP